MSKVYTVVSNLVLQAFFRLLVVPLFVLIEWLFISKDADEYYRQKAGRSDEMLPAVGWCFVVFTSAVIAGAVLEWIGVVP